MVYRISNWGRYICDKCGSPFRGYDPVIDTLASVTVVCQSCFDEAMSKARESQSKKPKLEEKKCTYK